MAHARLSEQPIKVVIVGAEGTGKSTLLGKIIDPSARGAGDYRPTIGVDFKIFKSGDNKLQFWDTSGQYRFASIVSSYLRGASVLLLVINNKTPIAKQLDHFKHLIQNSNEKNLSCAVIFNKQSGNQIDSESDADITQAVNSTFSELGIDMKGSILTGDICAPQFDLSSLTQTLIACAGETVTPSKPTADEKAAPTPVATPKPTGMLSWLSCCFFSACCKPSTSELTPEDAPNEGSYLIPSSSPKPTYHGGDRS